MAIDARYRALPYEPLLGRAMRDREAAEDAIQFFDSLATEDVANSQYRDDPIWLELAPVARRIVRERPGILERCFSTRAWDAVYWLLAPNRRNQEGRNPTGLAEIAVFGAEPFSSGATAGQGIPLRFVRPDTARTVAEFVESSLESVARLCDLDAMEAAGVYKGPQDRDHLLDLLGRYVDLYRSAADLGECVLVKLD
ncbi:DUF1877 family protein [Nocardia huaxiensis]|uniref:DUF1877 family protein n=1 Tax=Nocardia huaxiensis TaxID=2755382 RepID=A0A7D6Z685_9NOCA|nr:DUF1877 family protein [Nocardia huaxiensis]QLY32604.1 DUF1877 family protein [Nocardia huaxiensis]UFS93668.1 YfbM family protein [Nocardia huaxiensis]